MSGNKNNISTSNALSFISSGVACFSLLLLDSLGVIKKIVDDQKVSVRLLNTFKDKLSIERAILELEIQGILKKVKSSFKFTKLGKEVVQNLGLIHYIYKGYCHVLSNPMDKIIIDHSAVVRGSNLLGKEYIDKQILKELKALSSHHTICDLGCGDGARLLDLCKKFKCKGLGFELESSDLERVKGKMPKSITIHSADISKLKGEWDEVDVLLQVMVMHDFTPIGTLKNILNSLLVHFPNAKYFLYCDIVAPSQVLKSNLPGFDFIHSLLGIRTRTYEETINSFKKSKFKIFKEIPIAKMPNTFLWVLSPK